VSTPITLSGFNNIDFQSVINIMMQQARKPLNGLQAQLSTAQNKLAAYDTLNSQLSSVQSAFDDLQSDSSYGSLQVATSDTSTLTASVDSSAVRGTFNLHVTSLARPQVTASGANQFSDINANILNAGTFAITQNGVTTTIDLTAGTYTKAADGSSNPVETGLGRIASLAKLRDAINLSQSGVSASIINDGSSGNPFRLILSSKTPGTANGFTVSDQSSSSSQAAGAVLNMATDATEGVAKNTILTYNGIQIQRSSTTLSNVIPGLTINVLKEGQTTLTVSDDPSVLKSKITAVVNALNSFDTYSQSQLRMPIGSSTPPVLYNDLTLKTSNRQLKDAFLSNYVVSGSSMKNIADLGIQFDRNGKLIIDSTKLDDAISNHASDVQNFFSNATNGLCKVANNLVDSYTKSGGVIDFSHDRLQGSIDNMNARISAMQDQLSIQQQSLTAQFTAADQAISQLNNQGNSISSLSSLTWI
jgi:flagellar hook-associated protein 2